MTREAVGVRKSSAHIDQVAVSVLQENELPDDQAGARAVDAAGDAQLVVSTHHPINEDQTRRADRNVRLWSSVSIKPKTWTPSLETIWIRLAASGVNVPPPWHRSAGNCRGSRSSPSSGRCPSGAGSAIRSLGSTRRGRHPAPCSSTPGRPSPSCPP